MIAFLIVRQRWRAISLHPDTFRYPAVNYQDSHSYPGPYFIKTKTAFPDIDLQQKRLDFDSLIRYNFGFESGFYPLFWLLTHNI